MEIFFKKLQKNAVQNKWNIYWKLRKENDGLCFFS